MTVTKKMQIYLIVARTTEHIDWADRNLILAVVAKSLGLCHTFYEGKFYLETVRRGYIKTLASVAY